MAKHPGTINDLRFLQRNRIVSEQQLQRSWYRELIHTYGVDASYFRQDFDAFTTLSAKNYDPIYGEQASTSYWLSAGVIIFMEALGDQVLLNKLGIETNGDFDAYILIDDFTEQFRDLVGSPKVDTFVSLLSGEFSNGIGTLYTDIKNEDLNGYTSAELIFLTSGEVSGYYEGIFERHPVLYHQHMYRSGSYIQRIVLGELTGDYSGYLDENLNGIISGVISGELGYYTTYSKDGGGNNWFIAPKVGDFFRLDFYNEQNGELYNNHEEYEITQVIDRNLQVDGLNPLLSKYVWQMACVRRDPSHEDVIGASNNTNSNLNGIDGRKEEEFTTDKSFHNEWIEDASNEIFDYSEKVVDDIDGLNSDDVYGDYSLD